MNAERTLRRPTRRTFSGYDWPRILSDIAWLLGEEILHLPGDRTPIGARALSEYLGYPRNTIRRWVEEDADLRSIDAEDIIGVWMSLCGKRREFVPVRAVSLSASKVKG